MLKSELAAVESRSFYSSLTAPTYPPTQPAKLRGLCDAYDTAPALLPALHCGLTQFRSDEAGWDEYESAQTNIMRARHDSQVVEQSRSAFLIASVDSDCLLPMHVL